MCASNNFYIALNGTRRKIIGATRVEVLFLSSSARRGRMPRAFRDDDKIITRRMASPSPAPLAGVPVTGRRNKDRESEKKRHIERWSWYNFFVLFALRSSPLGWFGLRGTVIISISYRMRPMRAVEPRSMCQLWKGKWFCLLLTCVFDGRYSGCHIKTWQRQDTWTRRQGHVHHYRPTNRFVAWRERPRQCTKSDTRWRAMVTLRSFAPDLVVAKFMISPTRLTSSTANINSPDANL